MKRKRQAGFTLAEIAIVLVVITLLLAGIVKGQSIILQSRIKNTIGDMNAIVAAVELYKDRYHLVPGDDPNAGTRWSGSVSGNGDRRIQGLYNAVASNPPTSAEESNLFWMHLRQSGLLTGESTGPEAARQPWNKVDGQFGVQETTNMLGMSSPMLCLTVPGKVAIGIDLHLDDGKPNTGSVRAMVGTFATDLGATPATNYTEDVDSYIVCQPLNDKRN